MNVLVMHCTLPKFSSLSIYFSSDVFHDEVELLDTLRFNDDIEP